MFPAYFRRFFLRRGNALFFFIGLTQRERRRRKCFERKYTRVKALAFPLYDPTRIYGPLPGITFSILCYISVGNPSRFSSFVMIRRDASDVAVQFIECKYVKEICVNAIFRGISGNRIISQIRDQ